MKFEDLVREYVPTEISGDCGYSPLGKTFYTDNQYYKGSYWYYEGDGFIIDIHDFFMKKDYVEPANVELKNHAMLISMYILSGSGEILNPYQSFGPGDMFVTDTISTPKRHLFHGNSRFFVVGINYKEKMIEDYLLSKSKIKISDIPKLFSDNQYTIKPQIGKIANEIISYKSEGVSAKLFFDAKAREWLSVSVDAFFNRTEKTILSISDKNAIENVAKYIDDHFAFNITQDFLEKIATMSGTKLKESFKNIYNMSITEYTQRKRINIAETLLMNTDLEIKDVAKSVGYNSASRFSTLFKRYKGIHPREIRTLIKTEGFSK